MALSGAPLQTTPYTESRKRFKKAVLYAEDVNERVQKEKKKIRSLFSSTLFCADDLWVFSAETTANNASGICHKQQTILPNKSTILIEINMVSIYTSQQR